MDTIGERLKKLRKAKGWTLEQTANKLDLKGYSTYSNWEYDRTEPDCHFLKRLSEVFSVSIDYLVTGHSMFITKGEMEQLIEKESIGLDLTDEQIREIITKAFDIVRVIRFE